MLAKSAPKNQKGIFKIRIILQNVRVFFIQFYK